MRLLLDIHLLVWTMGCPQPRLPAGLASMLEDPGHSPLFSVASLWELVISGARADPTSTCSRPSCAGPCWMGAGWSSRSKRTMPWRSPPLHRDPFDRKLLAQASVDVVLLITADSQLAPCPALVRLMLPGRGAHFNLQ